jgi:hypothetical protein
MKHILILLLTLCLAQTAVAMPNFTECNDDITKSKQIEQEVALPKEMRFEITNKYGDIHLHTWDKPRAKWVVTIKATAKTDYAAQKMLDNISINTTHTASVLKLTTTFTELIKSYKQEFSINYEVFIPKTNIVLLENKYGNIYTDDLSNNIAIDLDYGDLKATQMNTDFLLNLSFGNATIDKIKNGIFNVKYSDVAIENIYTGIFKTSYSSVSITDSEDTIWVRAQYDNYVIDNANRVGIKAGYSDFKIKNLNKNLSGDFKFGDFTLNNVNQTFKQITCEIDYGDINIFLPTTSNCYLDLQNSFGDIGFPRGKLQRSNIDIEENNKTVKGYLGNPTNKTATVQIEAKFGDINLNLK